VTEISGFPPLCRPDARILILGSMPGRESLAQQRYYAHPRNSFWPVVTGLFGITATDYEQKSAQLTLRGVAVWDVLKTCYRSGSLDADINDRTLVTNDFQAFFAQHPDIARVFFNGAKAEAVYLKRVLPGLAGSPAILKLQRLPSTSPAYAGMTL
jgi:hypoxanthine-DNA glycosylase